MGKGPNENFDICLDFGEGREQTFERIIKQEQCARVTIEHKSDRIASRTKRAFIEYRQRGAKEWHRHHEGGLLRHRNRVREVDCHANGRTEANLQKVISEHSDRGKVEGGDFKQYVGVLVLPVRDDLTLGVV